MTVVFVTNYRYHISPSKSSPDEYQSTECEIMEIDSEVKYFKNLNMVIAILKLFSCFMFLYILSQLLFSLRAGSVVRVCGKFLAGGVAIPQGVLGPLPSRVCGSAAKNFSRTRTTQPARGLIIDVRGVLQKKKF